MLNIKNIEMKPGTMKLGLLCLMYLAAFAGAQVLTFYVSSLSGIILFFAILTGLIIHSAVTQDEAERGLWLALGLVPLVRIISLAVPVAEISEIYLYLIMAVIIFVGAFAVILNLKYNLDSDLGINGRKILIQSLVGIAGIGLGIIDYFILKPDGLITELTVQTIVIPAFILLVATGFIEELVFRGVIQRAARGLGPWGWVYVALVYTILQIGQGSVGHIGFVFIVTIFYGWIVKKTGSIIGVSVSHGLLNIALFLVLPHIWG